jgi:SAM-dependent methyltransferase
MSEPNPISEKQSGQTLADWWRSFYDDLPFDLLLQAEDRDIDEPVQFIKERLKISGGSLLFDQCCGMGSLSLPLARAGVHVVGVDLCAKFIEAAKEKAVAENLANCNFEQGDAFAFKANNCDAAINWWTSFGYGVSDAQNKLMIDRAFDSLRDGGHFALDFPNMANVINKFESYKKRQNKFVKDGQEVVLERESSLDLIGGYLKQVWKYNFADGTSSESRSSVRLYLANRLVQLFEESGFVNMEVFGDTKGNPLGLDSDRCIIIGKKDSQKKGQTGR